VAWRRLHSRMVSARAGSMSVRKARTRPWESRTSTLSLASATTRAWSSVKTMYGMLRLLPLPVYPATERGVNALAHLGALGPGCAHFPDPERKPHASTKTRYNGPRKRCHLIPLRQLASQKKGRCEMEPWIRLFPHGPEEFPSMDHLMAW